MKNYMFEKLKSHIGHQICCVAYGDIENPSDVCIECEDCGEVLVSAEDFDSNDTESSFIYGLKVDEDNIAYLLEKEACECLSLLQESISVFDDLDIAIDECDRFNERLGSGKTYIIRLASSERLDEKEKRDASMTIKKYLSTHGWEAECDSVPCNVMNVDVVFTNAEGHEDETEFSIAAYDSDELEQLYRDFCEENGFRQDTVLRVCIVQMADCMEELD